MKKILKIIMLIALLLMLKADSKIEDTNIDKKNNNLTNAAK